MKILITGFKSFGIKGFITKKNSSEMFANKLRSSNCEVLIMPVNNNCIKILKRKIKEVKPNLIFMMGERSFGIETSAYGLTSVFALKIKKKFEEKKLSDAGNYYCGKAYAEAIKSSCWNVIFVHLGLFTSFKKIRKIFEECKNAV